MSDLVPTGGHYEPILATLGDISVTHHWVQVPSGNYPIRGTTWTVQEHTHVEEKISTAGIVLAIIFVWVCLLGLLFLLMKERRTVGWVQVTVQGQGLYYATMLPALSGPHAHQFVNYARQLSVH